MSIRQERRRSTLVLVVLLALVLCMPDVLFRAVPAHAAPTQITWVASSARPYSDPVWYPLRRTANVSCNFQNAGCGSFHSYWALDLLGAKGDPVYAAGAGVLHVGSTDRTCKTSSSPDAPGLWVWIDHGAGIVSRYHHLDSIAVSEGALVTPSTRIGAMGSTGDFAPCTTNYLHFEVRTGGVKGTRVNPGQLAGCEGTRRQAYPAVWGYSAWNQVAKVSRQTPALDNGCLPSATTAPTAPSSATGARGNAQAVVRWTAATSAVGSVNRYVVAQELWSPSVGRWNDPTFRTVSASQLSTTFTGLVNGRRYRYRVLAHNSVGNSAWTRYVEVVPATAPTIPATDRGLTAAYDSVRLAWWKATAQGTPVTSYTFAIRRQKGTDWTAWTYRAVPADTLSYTYTGLREGTTYQVTVRANSAVGSSRFGTYRSITTPRR